MSLDNGRGGIIDEKNNVLLADNVTEKIAAIPRSNGVDFWLLLHQINNNVFPIYHISSNGIILTHELGLGIFHNYYLTELQGHMKASPDNKKLVVTLRRSDQSGFKPAPVELFDFDNTTGLLSNARHLGEYSAAFGVSFSPNSKMLYIHGFAETGTEAGDFLYQLDLEEANPIDTRKGLLMLNPFLNFNNSLANLTLQLGPDGKIYGAGSPNNDQSTNLNSLFVINFPNKKAYEADLRIVYFNWTEQRIGIDLPNYIQSYFRDLEPSENPNTACTSQTTVKVSPNPTFDYIEINIKETCFKPYKVIIYNNLAQEISEIKIKDQLTQLSLKNLAAGEYYLILDLQDHKFFKRIVKE